MKLTPGFTVTDYKARPGGYYHISFRNAKGQRIVVTQTGRGGCNHYTSPNGNIKAAFDVWLGANDGFAIQSMDDMGFHDLAVTVSERGIEWQDTVVLAIANAIELGVLTVEG